MKKFFVKALCGAALVVPAALLTSCSNVKKEVKQFATDFATKVSQNQKDSLLAVWPDVAKADSLALAFNADSIKVEETETPGTFKVSLGPGTAMTVTKSEDGKMTVSDTRGLFAWKTGEMDFAKKTGWVKDGMSDTELAAQFADTLFVNYVSEEFMKTFKEKFRIKKVTDNRYENASDLTGGGNWFVTVANDLDIDIAGSDYAVTLTSPVQRGKVVTIEGQDLFAGGSETLKSPFLMDDFYVLYSDAMYAKDPAVRLVYNLSTVEILNKYFHPKGDEYENYLKSKQ